MDPNKLPQAPRIAQSETSYFSKPEARLDPGLFRDDKIIPSIRNGILATLFGHLSQEYSSPESWSTVWLAGSGVSYQWSAHREPADLDCLIGVNFVIFRQSNDRFVGLSNNEIADMLNEGFREHLHPKTENYLGTYELTFYVNPASDIRAIKPYAAYSLTNDSWTVMASPEEQTFPNDWFETADRDVRMAEDIITRYQAALNDMSMAQSEVVKANARTGLLLALRQGAALFDDIHTGRRQAFGPMGSGYGDYTNFRWQRGKATGAVHALKQLHKFNQSMNREVERELYGSELPGTSTLIRRAASQYRK